MKKLLQKSNIEIVNLNTKIAYNESRITRIINFRRW